MGWQSLTANRLRSFLTASTVALGACTITVLVSLASSALSTITSGVDAIGGRAMIFVEPKEPRGVRAQAETPLSLADADAIRERVPGLSQVAYLMALRGQVLLGEGRRADVDVAMGALYERLLLQRIRFGRGLDPDEAREDPSSILLSEPIATKLFGQPEGAVGKTVLLWGRRYRVVGVTSDAAVMGFHMGGVSKQRAVILGRRAIVGEGVPQHGFIALYDDGTASHDTLIRLTAAILGHRHRHADDIEFFDFGKFLYRFDVVFAGLRVLIGLIASVALFIAGAGIMNVILAAVRQRVAEIGIRRALGATERDIRRQFVTESVLLAGGGGLFGCLVGMLLMLLVGLVARHVAPTFRAEVSLPAMIVAFLAALALGALFGQRPAARAAKLPVVRCLHEAA